MKWYRSFAIIIFMLSLQANATAVSNQPEAAAVAAASPVTVLDKKAQYSWTLTDIRKLAEAQNPDLKAAKATQAGASGVVLQAVSGYLPHIDVGGTAEQTSLPSPSAGLSDQLGTSLPYTHLMARIHQVVFDFGRTLNTIGAARGASQSAEEDTVAVHDAVMLAAQQAFYNALGAEKLVAVAQQGVVQFQETARRIGIFVRTGTRPTFDLTQANVKVSQAKLALVEAINTRDVADVTLLNIIGMPKEVTFQLLEETTAEDIPLDRLNLNTLTEKAIQARPEIKRSEFSIESARMREHSVAKEYLPMLGFEGWYGQYYPNYPSSIANAYGLGLTLTWNLFDGMETTGRLQETAARVEYEIAGLEKARERVVSDVATSVAQVKKADTILKLSNESLNFSKENARLALRRYNSNVATFLELLVAQTSLLDAQSAVVQAQYQYQYAIAQLKYSVKAPLFE